MVNATLPALDSEDAAGVYNIGTGREAMVNSLAQMLIRVSGKKKTPTHAPPPREGEIRRSAADISRAKNQLRSTTRTSLENDLRELWSWQQESATKEWSVEFVVPVEENSATQPHHLLGGSSSGSIKPRVD